MSKDKIREAMERCWRAAMAVSRQDPDLATRAREGAEATIIIRLLSAQLPGGEVEFYEMVEKELRR